MSNRGTWKLNVGGTDLATYDDVLTGLRSGGGPILQTEALLGAAQPARFGRENTVVELGFTLTREHADNAASATFFMLGALTFNGVRDVTIVHQSHAGAETSWTMTAAEVIVQTDDPIGVTTISQVTIRGFPVATP